MKISWDQTLYHLIQLENQREGIKGTLPLNLPKKEKKSLVSIQRCTSGYINCDI